MPRMMYEEDDIHDDDSDMDDDMMISAHLSSKESAAFHPRRFGEGDCGTLTRGL